VGEGAAALIPFHNLSSHPTPTTTPPHHHTTTPHHHHTTPPHHHHTTTPPHHTTITPHQPHPTHNTHPNPIPSSHCGPGRNLTLWAEALVATGRPMLVENCNDEFPFRPTVNPDGSLDCPYNFYRTGSDNSPSFYTIVANLMQLNDYLNISQPNCFAYGDMLEVGAPAPQIPTHCNGTQRLTYDEALAHFNAWAVLSSPLILGLDLTNTSEYDMWWPIISNTEAIAINQAWAGEAGHLVAASSAMYEGPIYAGCLCEATRAAGSYPIPMWTVWGKPLPGGLFAAIAINTMPDRGAETSVTSAQLGFPAGATLAVRDVAAHADLPDIVGGVWNISLGPRGSQFLLFKPK
jgi:hypothetical protein